VISQDDIAEDGMAQLVVRNLDERVKDSLKAQAARNGRSLEAEVREVLRSAVEAPPADPPGHGLGSRIAARFRGIGLSDAEAGALALKGFAPRPPPFGDQG
jgi:plasmid stability protein